MDDDDDERSSQIGLCGLVIEYGIAQPKTKRCFQNDSIGIKKRKKAFWFEKNAAGGDLILTSTIS